MTVQGSVEERLNAVERELAGLREEATRATKGQRVWRTRFRYTIVMAGLLALTVTGVSVGVTGEPLRLSQRTPATGNATAETHVASENGTGYTLRLTNNNTSGDGGALGGTCRSVISNEACIVGFNANTGRAFDFATNGSVGGRISAANASAKPFTTNAGGVADGLNADKVDGKDGPELQDVLGSGALRGEFGGDGCTSSTNCPLRHNNNVTSVTRPATGIYCIQVAGASPGENMMIAGSNAAASITVNARNGATRSICPAGHFEVNTEHSGTETNAAIWFAVLR